VNIVWESGLEVKNEQKSASGDVQMRITNVYGETGELLRKTVENIQGGSVQVTEFEYTFRPART
jgi:predicted regulator of amino acid metabolism with ACT domain